MFKALTTGLVHLDQVILNFEDISFRLSVEKRANGRKLQLSSLS